MATTEIEKLERRYAENPQGLTFAPLAEVHRKNGEVARALELLKAGLELHPNYIPASIVLGRCHWDLGDLPAAEAAFSHVLRLDDENVIALKSLADINERLGRFSDAQRWLNRLIAVDRSNEEARQQLARIETAKQQPVAADAKIAADAKEAVSAKRTAAEPTGKMPEPAIGEAERAPSPVTASNATSPEAKRPEPKPPEERLPKPNLAEPSSVQDGPVDLTAVIAEPKSSPELQFLDIAEPPQNPEPPQAAPPPSEPADSPEEAPAVPGLISQEFVPPKEGSYHLHPELAHDFGSAESPEPARSPEVEDLGVETTEEVELQSSGASEFRVPNAAEEFMDAGITTPAPASEIEMAPPPAFEAPPAVEGPPELQKSAPTAESPPTQPPVAVPDPARTQEPTPRSYSVRETKGQSVVAFFQSLLSARPTGSPASAVSSAGAAQEGAPANAGAAAAGSAPPSAGSPDNVSFDDFFNAATSGSSSGNKEGDPSKDDLDQFQSWLQNLKR
ncbi:MAG: tetratricopeptide repeat protein [Gemmatimonadales bacterium]